MVSIKRIHLLIGLVLSIMIPTATSVSAYYKSTENFVRKDDVKAMNEKLDRLAEDTATIKGMMAEHLRRHR